MAKKYFISLQYLSIFFSLLIYSFWAAPSIAAEPVPSKLEQASLPLSKYFDWYVDTNGTLSIENIQAQEIQDQFAPLDLKKISNETGTAWIRFTIAEQDSDTSSALLLDLGEGIPKSPTLYAPKHDALTDTIKWQEYTPTQQSIFLMPEAKTGTITAYIRMNGLPSPWFNPTLRTPHDAATTLERMVKPATIVALSVVMLLALLRGLTETGQWRFWASLYTAVVLLYVIWGMPPTAKGYIALKDMVSAVAPGVALILLPHVARHLMRSSFYSRTIDLQYRLLIIPGILLALIPFVPGYAWTVRYLTLWPAITLLFVPTTIGAWLGGLPGARRFLIGILLPPLGVALAIVGLNEPHFLPLSVLQALPLWGIVLGILIIAGTTTPQEYRKREEQAPAKKTKKAKAIAKETLNDLEDPNLRLVTISEAQSSKKSSKKNEGNLGNDLEEHLRWPVDQLLRDVSALESCALPPVVREYVSSLATVARDISNSLSAPVHERGTAQPMGGMSDDIFELQGLLRQAHDSVSTLADNKNIALSWFMPPHLSQSYRGDAMHLLFVLRLLLESAVRATNRGAVQLAVRRVPESINPGHLLFTVTDTGTGKPPQERSISALARAWELAARNHGFLGVESNAYGASVSFTMHCDVTTQDMLHRSTKAKETQYPCVVVISDNDADRQLWAFFLEKLPLAIVEARNPKETLEVFSSHDTKLLIFDARIPKHHLEQSINNLRQYELEHNCPAALYLALSADDTMDQEFEAMGFDYIVSMPVTRSKLRKSVTTILPWISKSKDDVKDKTDAGLLKQLQNDDVIIDTGTPIVEMPELSLDKTTTPEVSNVVTSATMAETVADNLSGSNGQKQPSSVPELSLNLEPELVLTTPSEEGNAYLPSVEPEAKAEPLPQTQPEFTPITMPEPEHKSNAVSKSQHIMSSDDAVQPVTMSEQDIAAYISKQKEQNEIQTKQVLDNQEALSSTKLVTKPKINITKKEPAKSKSSTAKPALTQPKPEVAPTVTPIEPEAAPEVMSTAPTVTPIEPEAAPTVTPIEPETAPEVPSKKIQIKSHAIKGKNNIKANSDAKPTPTKKPTALNIKQNRQQGSSTVTSKNDAATQQVTQPEPSIDSKAVPQVKPRVSGSTSKHDNSLSDAILLPLMDYPAPEEQSKQDNSEGETFIEPKKDKSNAAYLTSLVDTAPSKNRVTASKVEDNNAPKKGMTIVSTAKSSKPVAKPVIKQQNEADVQAKPAEQLSPNGVGEPKPMSKQDSVKKDKPKITISQNTEKGTVPTVAQSKEVTKVTTMPKQDVAKANSVDKNEWVGEPQPISKQNTKDSNSTGDSKAISTNFTVPYTANEQKQSTAPVPSHDAKQKVDMVADTPSDDADDTINLNMAPLANTIAQASKPEPSIQPRPAQRFVPPPPLPDSTPANPLHDLLDSLDSNLLIGKEHFKASNAEGVAEAASSIANSAENFGLRTLSRLARTVESAAKAGDMDALHDLFPELEMSVERNRIALKV